MYKINIRISPDREVSLSSHSGGVTGENNAATLNFEVPSEYSSFNKYLDIFKESGEKTQTALSLQDEKEFSYLLPGVLCDNLNVYMQLVMKKGNAVFKSMRFALTFEEGINATSYLESEYQDSIQELFEIKADKDEVRELSKALSDKVAAQVFYNEKLNLQNSIDGKADRSELEKALVLKADKTDVESALKLKVDKEEGKALSSNDFTDAEKEKLLKIADGAEANVQSDWNETDETSDSFIKNKPFVPIKLSDLEDDSNSEPVRKAFNAVADIENRYIHETYATKEELAEAIGEALEGDY